MIPLVMLASVAEHPPVITLVTMRVAKFCATTCGMMNTINSTYMSYGTLLASTNMLPSSSYQIAPPDAEMFHERQAQHRCSGSTQCPRENRPVGVWEIFIADLEALINLFSSTCHGSAINLDYKGHETGEEGDSPFLGL